MREDEFDMMVKEIDEILHEYGFIVDNDKLKRYILETIKESNPRDNIKVEPKRAEPIYKILRLKSQSELDRLFK